MAAPAASTVKNLNGQWTMNKSESDPTDPILSLQGIGWILRKAIGSMTVTLNITQTTEPDGTVILKIVQPGPAGFKGTEENRHLPPDNDLLWRDHEDHIFGHVKGFSRFFKLTDLADTDEHEKFLKAGWLDEPEFIETYVESQGNDWTARQLWGFAEVGGVRKYVRKVVVKKGKEFKHARLVYDFIKPTAD